jgi:serine/threonine protein kinase
VAKVMRPDRAGDRGVRASLKREGCLLKRLMHPHIVRAYEWIERPEPAVILETIPGDALDYILLYPLQTGPAQA